MFCDALGLAKLIDHDVASPLFDDSLDLGALVSPKDYETVVLGVNAIVVFDGYGDHAAAPVPSALAENFDQLVGSAACLLDGMLDLAVGRPKHRFVLGNALVSLVHAAEFRQVPISARSRYGFAMGKNILVISTVQHADDVLRGQFGENDTIKVVVPVTGQGILDWLANDEKAFGQAERVAERTAERLPGETVDAVAGEAKVALAISDALASFPAEEIVVAVRPDDEKGFVESMATKGAPQHSFQGVPIRYVVVRD